MPPSGYFIDANLLVLFVVGSTDVNLIAKHRRLRGYSEEDYHILTDMLEQAERIFVTPNTLTEASNLLGQHGDPERLNLFESLKFIIQQKCVEIFVESASASSRSEFIRLGLTDSALLEAVSEEAPLVTVDADLYMAALNDGRNAALNFNHLRDL